MTKRELIALLNSLNHGEVDSRDIKFLNISMKFPWKLDAEFNFPSSFHRKLVYNVS